VTCRDETSAGGGSRSHWQQRDHRLFDSTIGSCRNDDDQQLDIAGGNFLIWLPEAPPFVGSAWLAADLTWPSYAKEPAKFDDKTSKFQIISKKKERLKQ
jgi:hypothetical protein